MLDWGYETFQFLGGGETFGLLAIEMAIESLIQQNRKHNSKLNLVALYSTSHDGVIENCISIRKQKYLYLAWVHF